MRKVLLSGKINFLVHKSTFTFGGKFARKKNFVWYITANSVHDSHAMLAK